ncbi:adenosylcobalamin-dependent ribonucleoside-diphosphate reductase [Thermosulfurimonas marina]|uniref:Vitamin B12-dependent ribonucleotide reductase n=1 Tax=Thermosulfurimonas marina TaxID=2047767 RepID=A0A6H1WR19_9BACT|nr:adenosylcobalamin-dependent ribonucleoside-diphosphate reductase [Thermosulfurimonas marina]QJA05642.1 adenosylcobalamin-dependent ribonucleoside-diphosphate reductase [Thermosulfurimonas marina]
MKLPRTDLPLSRPALLVLAYRYLVRDEKGDPVETPEEMFWRVARAVAEAEREFGEDPEFWAERFYQLMASLDFLPNSPTLMNAGLPLGQLSACFVLPVEDSLEAIFEALKAAALIHKSGGGTGFSFSRLRPKGDVVRTTQGVASGPVSFMRVFDAATEAIKQGGKRRGANMGILRVDHPDIEEFILIKRDPRELRNFNISVAVTEDFIKALKQGADFPLINPRTGQETRRVKARHLFDLLTESAWMTGDPGVIFLDTINRANPTPLLGPIESTNPCGEQPLLPYESCNLGSINLSRFVKDRQVDYPRLGKTVRLAVRFLDDVIEVNRFPLPQIARITRLNRKIGLGVMGFADLLIRLGIPYDSAEAVKLAEEIMAFIERESVAESQRLGEIRGSFPAFPGSLWDEKGFPAMRNATTTTVAPTGTLSLIAGTSSGIEPLFALAYRRRALEGVEWTEIHPEFLKALEERKLPVEDIVAEVLERGGLSGIKGVPEDLKRLFVTAFEVSPERHLAIQAAFQRHTHNAVSKTINLPEDTPKEEIGRIYLKAYELGLKGVTIYRYGSRPEAPLRLAREESCPECGEPLEPREQCLFCAGCGYSAGCG